MDVNKINQVKDPHPSALNRRTSAKGFRQILAGKLFERGPIAPCAYRDPKTELLDHSGKILDLLDDYVQQLNDSAFTLKEIAPLTERIETEMRMLDAKTADIIPQNADLEHFVRDLSVTAQVAVLKFKRGDYV